MFTVETISAHQRNNILGLAEGHFHDLKSKDITPGKLTKTISGFANAAGGELYVGIDESAQLNNPKRRTWRGFADEEEANGHIQAFETVLPFGSSMHATFLKSASDVGLVLQVQVLKTREICLATDGVAYLRRGAQSLPQKTEEQLARLRLDKGITSFETQTLDLPKEIVTTSETIHTFISSVVPTTTPEKWLCKQQLLRDGKPTVAALLLYSDEPQSALSKRSGIKLYRYKTTEAEGTRETLVGQPATIEGCAYNQIQVRLQRQQNLSRAFR